MNKKGNYLPDKSLGQHFLVNRNICKHIVELLELSDTDNVLEIGPGQGALSGLLKSAPHKKLLSLERDRRFIPLLKSIFAPGELALADALSFNWKKLEGNWKLVGNLPYNIASPLIWDILSGCPGLSLAVFMVQQEVGQRIIAQPGNRHYGALSVWCQCHATPKNEIRVAPGSFSPPPKVFSSVISFRPIPFGQRPEFPGSLQAILRFFFQQRRKQIGTILKKSQFAFLADILASMGTDLQSRPETLAPVQYLELSQKLGILQNESGQN